MKRITPERKSAVLAKLLPPHDMAISVVAQATATLYSWRRQAVIPPFSTEVLSRMMLTEPVSASASSHSIGKNLYYSADYAADISVSHVACLFGINTNQIFKWRKQYENGFLTALKSGENVVPASELAAANKQIRELQRLFGKKTMERNS
uniref:Transposase n=1 Tax=Morganella morganii TaxID=582 RepID=A0AAI9HVL0_MORMO|nr:transposase [Morganella morganii]